MINTHMYVSRHDIIELFNKAITKSIYDKYEYDCNSTIDEFLKMCIFVFTGTDNPFDHRHWNSFILDSFILGCTVESPDWLFTLRHTIIADVYEKTGVLSD